LTYNMAENSWHRYDMKKLRHCHPMYILMIGLTDYSLSNYLAVVNEQP